jgi:phenylpyruvate tautomerase PptA (4-oxalocrotonate tautomerase family)
VPMLDAYIPEGALTPEAEQALLSDLTDLLLVHEGADPGNPVARSIAWVFLHRPAAVYVAGAPAAEPRYRIVASVPEGQFDPERRQAIVSAVTDRVLEAEGDSRPRDPSRVWVFTNEIPDGTWGGAGRIATLADIATLVTGDAERGRRIAEQRLALSRGLTTA